MNVNFIINQWILVANLPLPLKWFNVVTEKVEIFSSGIIARSCKTKEYFAQNMVFLWSQPGLKGPEKVDFIIIYQSMITTMYLSHVIQLCIHFFREVSKSRDRSEKAIPTPRVLTIVWFKHLNTKDDSCWYYPPLSNVLALLSPD